MAGRVLEEREFPGAQPLSVWVGTAKDSCDPTALSQSRTDQELLWQLSTSTLGSLSANGEAFLGPRAQCWHAPIVLGCECLGRAKVLVLSDGSQLLEEEPGHKSRRARGYFTGLEHSWEGKMPKMSWGMEEIGIVSVASLGAAGAPVCPCHSTLLSLLLRHCSHLAWYRDRRVNAGGFEAQSWEVSLLCVWGQALVHLGWWGWVWSREGCAERGAGRIRL